MYAIIETGGKQYKVSEGDVIKVEKLAVEAGSAYAFDKGVTFGLVRSEVRPKVIGRKKLKIFLKFTLFSTVEPWKAWPESRNSVLRQDSTPQTHNFA